MTGGVGPVARLLTGPPRAGKSTALARTVDLLRDRDVPVSGFYTTEVRGPDGERAGFDIVAVGTGEATPLARRSWTQEPHQVGAYGVRTAALDRHLVATAARPATVVVVDEIGRMQLTHPGFDGYLDQLLSAGIPVLGTVHVFDDPVTDRIKARADVELVTVTESTRDRLPARLAAALTSDLRARR